jgi:hypothetical protein
VLSNRGLGYRDKTASNVEVLSNRGLAYRDKTASNVEVLSNCGLGYRDKTASNVEVLSNVSSRLLNPAGRNFMPVSCWYICWAFTSTLKMEATCSSEMSVDTHRTTLRKDRC